MLLTARLIKQACGDIPFIFRAGVWKPRTSPYTFQGVGEQALEWLQEVKQTFGIPVATEVATPEHVEKACKAQIDYLWIGARTSANPIAVQALANAIHDAKGVLVKNPVNADPALWIGNIERLQKTGIPVIAVLRGCNHKPSWFMAHALRQAKPDIPILIDPSHISGDATKIPKLLSKAAELELNGAMIEVHPNPKEALSDAKQQITPDTLRDLVQVSSELEAGFNLCATPPRGTTLEWLRAEIDELDDTLWETIAARMDVSRRIGEWKKAHGVAPLQPERVKIISERLKSIGQDLNLSAEFMQQIWELIHEESLKQQE